MKVEQAVAPTLEEFKRLAREEFSFVQAHEFREVPPPIERYQNPYEVHFQTSDGWRIVVGGYSYGFSADVDIRSPDGRSASLGHFVPQKFWEQRRSEFARGQQGDIGYRALCLRTFGLPFLNHDWRVFEELVRKQEEWKISNREAWERSERERLMERAIRRADEAFRDGRYSEAEVELAEFEPYLPPSQSRKLEIARRRKRG